MDKYRVSPRLFRQIFRLFRLSNFKQRVSVLSVCSKYYDVLIEYKGNRYILVADDNGCSVTNEIWDDLSPEFLTANDLIKDFRFPDGEGLLDIVDNQDFKIDIY